MTNPPKETPMATILCVQCEAPAELTIHDGYGPGQGTDYCIQCFRADYSPATPIETYAYGRDAVVLTIIDGDTCANCGLELIAPDAIHTGPREVKG